jgi:hypothetical protein
MEFWAESLFLRQISMLRLSDSSAKARLSRVAQLGEKL